MPGAQDDRRKDIVDLWDISKILWRRWYFAVPFLVATVSIVMVAAQTVSPDYKATGYIQLVTPPSLGAAVDPNAPKRPHNPWIDLGLQALANAAQLKVADLQIMTDLKARGFSDSVTITLSDRLPVLSVEAVATTGPLATKTVREVIRLLNQDIQDEQTRFGVETIDTITALTLADGGSVETVTSKVKRVIIVAAGVGLLATAGATLAIDAMLRRRSRRREDPDALDFAGAAEPPMRRPLMDDRRSTAAPASPSVPPRMTYTVPPAAARTPTGEFPYRPPAASPVTVEYAQSAGPHGANPRSGESDPLTGFAGITEAPDTTVVLPLSHTGRRADGSNSGR